MDQERLQKRIFFSDILVKCILAATVTLECAEESPAHMFMGHQRGTIGMKKERENGSLKTTLCHAQRY